MLRGEDTAGEISATHAKERNLYGSADDMEFLPRLHGSSSSSSSSSSTRRGSHRRNGNGSREMNLFGAHMGDSDDYDMTGDDVVEGLGVSELSKQNDHLRKKVISWISIVMM